MTVTVVALSMACIMALVFVFNWFLVNEAFCYAPWTENLDLQLSVQSLPFLDVVCCSFSTKSAADGKCSEKKNSKKKNCLS